ncbi:4Fe-4S dicluster domain-containing protein [bacterium]|nr:4Fe-4S dicluster domain-containing protein [bacterium]
MNRIGVFICHCGLNIAGTVDVEKIVKLVSDYPEVVYATDYMYMCSDIANVDEEVCVGCGNCVNICAYDAVELDLITKKAKVNPVICEGCGTCSAACPSGAMQQNNFSKRQIFEMVNIFTV